MRDGGCNRLEAIVTSLFQSYRSVAALGLWTVAAAIMAAAIGARRFARVLKRRGDITALASFDDRALADIGLTRSDVRDAMAEPFWRDPSALLASRAAERRAHRPRALPAFRPLRRLCAPPHVPAATPAGRTKDIAA
jgi:uncharacterized protein YjiS (DUF1127 family)